ncbi:MAG TPA: M28 family metallopeptidase [Pyrinomonadaceae bacterium]|nr:M28 family metallopeptidase [Pyrinomonadaceae bacterium]
MPGIKNDTQNFQPRATKFTRVLCLFVLALAAAACPRNDKGPEPRVSVSDRPAEATTSVSGPTAFNGERAMDHVRKQIEFGPRIAGSAQLAKTREYIIGALKSYGLKVTTDEFNASTPIGERRLVNITAEVPGESRDVIVISSHYDTKLYTNMQFVGANDPGASVGTLLEIARVLGASQQKPKFTYWLVFFDGEESFCEGWEQCGKPDAPDNTYGSRYYVTQLRNHNELGRIRALILLDMMGYKNLELGRDDMSTRWLQDIVWRAAHDLGYGKYFVERPEGVGGDDHEPFLRAGIDSLDLIQLSGYPYWHRADDTADKISPQSMKIVGDVVLASLPRIEHYLQSKGR